MLPFYGQDYEKQKGPGTSYQSLLGLLNMFRKIPFLVIHHIGSFDDLIQSGFCVILKITFANLCKANHNVLIFTVSSDPFRLETVERKE